MLYRQFVVIALLTVAPFVAAGCGEESSSTAEDSAAAPEASADKATDPATAAYVQGLSTAGDQLAAAGGAIEQAGDWPAYRAGLQQLRAAVTAFENLTAPDDVAAEHEDLVESLRAAVQSAAKVTETSSEASDAQALEEATASLDTAGQSSSAILEQLGD